MDAHKSPVFIGQMASSYGGGQSSAPQAHCPGAPSTLPTPPCGGRTNNCEAKGEAKRLQDRPETITCNVTEYELTCKWEPRIVPKACTVMVPQYKAVCAGQNLTATVQQTYQVPARFDANGDRVIQQDEFEAARRAGALQAMGGANVVGAGAGGAAMGAQMGAVGGANMSAAMGGMQGAAMGGMTQGTGMSMGGGYGN